MTLVIDYETTDNANHKLPYTHPSQPMPAQLGAILYDKDRKIRGEMNFLVKPAGWTIQPGAQKVHGISQEDVERYGMPQYFVATALRMMLSKATVVASYNTDFDFLISDHWFDMIGESWRSSRLTGVCVMKTMQEVMKLPPKYPGQTDYAWPSLKQAYAHCFDGAEFAGAHDALNDVKAAAEVLFWAMDNGHPLKEFNV